MLAGVSSVSPQAPSTNGSRVGAFNYSRAVREWAFVQSPLMSLADFRKAAAARGLMAGGSPFDTSAWETLDREGLLPPVAYALDGFWDWDQPGLLASGDLIVREERGFVAWEELRAEAERRGDADNPTDLYVLYHHWQLLSLATIVDHLTPITPLPVLGQGLDVFADARAACASSPLDRDRLAEEARHNRDEELLLVRVQNVVLPYVRDGAYKGGKVVGLTDDAALWARALRQTFDFEAAAADCAVTADDLAMLFDRFATHAHRVDPMLRLFDLVDQVDRSHRERLAGSALRALDLYDAARVLRVWHAQLGDERLPDVDELVGSDARGVKRRLYGTDALRGNRAALPALLERFGLYPWRVQVIAEGKADLAMLEELLDVRFGYTFAELGIHAFSLDGADIPTNAELILGAVRVYSNYYLLLFDNEGRARQMVDALERDGHVEGVSAGQRAIAVAHAQAAVEASAFPNENERRDALREAVGRAERLGHVPGAAPESHIWERDLEADNFTVAEVCEVIVTLARQRDDMTSFSLDADRIAELVAAEADKPKPRRRGMARIVLEAAAGAHDPPFTPSKPVLARALARYAVEHPERDGIERRVLTLSEHLVRLTHAGRRLRGQLRQ